MKRKGRPECVLGRNTVLVCKGALTVLGAPISRLLGQQGPYPAQLMPSPPVSPLSLLSLWICGQ